MEKKFSAVEKVLFFPAQKFVQFFIISRAYARPARKKYFFFQINFLLAGNSEKNISSLSANYYFFQLKNLFKFFLFLRPMHIQEERKNVFLLAGNSEKNISSLSAIFFQLKNWFKFFLFLRPMHVQEESNNVFQINFLPAGNSEKIFLRCRQIFIFFKLKN